MDNSNLIKKQELILKTHKELMDKKLEEIKPFIGRWFYVNQDIELFDPISYCRFHYNKQYFSKYKKFKVINTINSWIGTNSFEIVFSDGEHMYIDITLKEHFIEIGEGSQIIVVPPEKYDPKVEAIAKELGDVYYPNFTANNRAKKRALKKMIKSGIDPKQIASKLELVGEEKDYKKDLNNRKPIYNNIRRK